MVKVLCVFVVGYALSPIDLIPDFIPILGYVDDAILLPGLIWLAIKLLPLNVVSTCREKATCWIAQHGRRPTNYVGAVVIVGIWLCCIFFGWYWYTG